MTNQSVKYFQLPMGIHFSTCFVLLFHLISSFIFYKMFLDVDAICGYIWHHLSEKTVPEMASKKCGGSQRGRFVCALLKNKKQQIEHIMLFESVSIAPFQTIAHVQKRLEEFKESNVKRTLSWKRLCNYRHGYGNGNGHDYDHGHGHGYDCDNNTPRLTSLL